MTVATRHMAAHVDGTLPYERYRITYGSITGWDIQGGYAAIRLEADNQRAQDTFPHNAYIIRKLEESIHA